MAEIVQGAINTVKLVREESDTVRDATLLGTGQDSDIPGQLLAANLTGLFRRTKRFMTYVRDKPIGLGLPTIYTGKTLGPTIEENNEEISRWDVEFLPMIVVRKNQHFINEDKESQLYIDQRRLCRHLKLDLNDITKNLSQQPVEGVPNETEENPDLDKLDDAYVLFGSDVYTAVDETYGYIYDWLVGLSEKAVQDESAFEAMLTTWRNEEIRIPEQYNVFKFHYDENNYDYKLNYNYISLSNGGSIPEGQKHAMEIVIEDPEYFPSPPEEAEEAIFMQQSYLIATKRHEDGSITSAKLHGPVITKYIHAEVGFVTTQVGLSEEFKDLDPLLNDEYGKSGFYFPIQFETYDAIFQREQNPILYDGMMLSLHAAEVVDLAWYQTSFFKMLITAVGMWLLFMSLGTVTWATITLWEIVGYIFSALVINYLAELVIKAVGGEAAIILAIAATIFAASKGYIKTSVFSLPLANDLLLVTNSILKTLQIEQTLEKEELMDEVTAFQKELIQKKEDLQVRIDALPPESDGPSIMTIIESTKTMHVNETPELYFHRTTQLDVNKLSLEAVTNFVPNALTLPELDITPDVFITV